MSLQDPPPPRRGRQSEQALRRELEARDQVREAERQKNAKTMTRVIWVIVLALLAAFLVPASNRELLATGLDDLFHEKPDKGPVGSFSPEIAVKALGLEGKIDETDLRFADEVTDFMSGGSPGRPKPADKPVEDSSPPP